MSAGLRSTDLRRALHVVADALADLLEAQSEEAPVEAPAAPPTVPNNDLAERFAREAIAKNGWPQPPRGRRAG